MKLTKPIIFLDTETTGVDTVKDRIVSLAVVKVMPDDTEQEKYTLINPLMKIPALATKVHGIKDEDVKDAPTFKQISKSLLEFFEGCDFAGYNIVAFDIPLLAEEFYRCGISFPPSKASFLDACTIFKKKEERTLSAAYRFFCGKELEGAHNSLVDTKATKEILFAQMKHYPDLKAIKQVVDFCKIDTRVDLAGKIIVNSQREYIYNFGKAKGKRLVDDPGFGRWMLTQDFISNNTKTILKELFEELSISL